MNELELYAFASRSRLAPPAWGSLRGPFLRGQSLLPLGKFCDGPPFADRKVEAQKADANGLSCTAPEPGNPCQSRREVSDSGLPSPVFSPTRPTLELPPVALPARHAPSSRDRQQQTIFSITVVSRPSCLRRT